MPREEDPNYAVRKDAISRERDKLNERALLVGHSIGATILINALAEAPSETAPRAVFLIAPPFIGRGGWPSDDIVAMDHLGARLPPNMGVYLYHGDEDQTAPPEHAGLYAKALPQAHIRRLSARNHQLNNDLTEVAADMDNEALWTVNGRDPWRSDLTSRALRTW